MHHHHNHPSFFKYFLNRELNEIYITVAIKHFALAMISIFVPIYLFQSGFDLNYIFLFFAILSGFFALTVYFAFKLSTRIGIKHGILISMPFLIAYYILLQFVTVNTLNWVFFLAPILAGIHCSLFWANFHTDFAAFSSKKIRAQQVSICSVFTLIFAALGPIIGGLILLHLGFNFLFIIVSALLILSTIPLFMTEENYIHKDFSIKKTLKVLKKITPIGISGFIGHGVVLCACYAWPLFMFLIVKAYLEVGALTSVTIFIGIFSTFFSGKLADHFGRGKILRIGSIFSTIIWSLRVFVRTAIEILGINILFGIVGPLSTGGPIFTAMNYDMAKKKHIAEVIFIREVVINSTATIFLLFLFFVSSLELALIFGAISSIFTFIFSFQKKKI